MHRHGYKGRKLGRTKDKRRALLKDLASALVKSGSIKTTLPKAKEVVPYLEKLITKAKKGDLHSRRQVIAKMANPEVGNKLVDEIAPKLGQRTSGHLRIVKETMGRRGDNAQMATVTFVDELKVAPVAKASQQKQNAKSKKQSSKPAAKAPKADSDDTKKAPTAPLKSASASGAKQQAPKRTSVRGNK